MLDFYVVYNLWKIQAEIDTLIQDHPVAQSLNPIFVG